MKKKIIGYFGCPPRDVLSRQRDSLNGTLVDLDVNTGAPDSSLLPRTTCRILRNIADNAFHLKRNLALIIASTGKDKCDGGRFLAELLVSHGFPVAFHENENKTPRRISISTSPLPLKEKIVRIMNTVHTFDERVYEICRPGMGFWGVPPNDLSLLELFPDSTHVYGWTRCVEAGVPASSELEWHTDPGVPTVFFVQTFCAKQIVAEELARKNNGLLVDMDGDMSKSARVKIEAFIRLKTRR